MKRRDQMIVLLAVTGLLVVCINLVVFNALARLKLVSAPKGFPSAELRPVGTEPIRIDSLTKCSYIRLPAFKVLAVGGSQNYGGATWRGAADVEDGDAPGSTPRGNAQGTAPVGRYCTEAVAGSVCSTAKLLLTCSLVRSLRISAASR